MMARFGYTLHLCFKAHFWVAYAAGMIGAVGIAHSFPQWQLGAATTFLSGYFQLFGAIVVAGCMAHVLTVDHDEGMKEVLQTYPGHRMRLAVERVVAGIVLSVTPFLLAALAMYVYLGSVLEPGVIERLQLGSMLVDSSASWLFLTGIILLVATVSENWLVGVFTGGLYWMIDLISDGRFTGNLFLFAQTFPTDALSPVLNRQLLFVAGGMMWFAAVMVFGRNCKRW